MQKSSTWWRQRPEGQGMRFGKYSLYCRFRSFKFTNEVSQYKGNNKTVWNVAKNYCLLFFILRRCGEWVSDDDVFSFGSRLFLHIITAGFIHQKLRLMRTHDRWNSKTMSHYFLGGYAVLNPFKYGWRTNSTHVSGTLLRIWIITLTQFVEVDLV